LRLVSRAPNSMQHQTIFQITLRRSLGVAITSSACRQTNDYNHTVHNQEYTLNLDPLLSVWWAGKSHSRYPDVARVVILSQRRFFHILNQDYAMFRYLVCMSISCHVLHISSIFFPLVDRHAFPVHVNVYRSCTFSLLTLILIERDHRQHTSAALTINENFDRGNTRCRHAHAFQLADDSACLRQMWDEVKMLILYFLETSTKEM
jgi:hypothetical protein